MDDLITIRMRLAGGQEVAAEAQVVSGEIKGIGDETAAAGTAAASATPKVEKHGKTWSRVGRVARLGALGAAGAIGLLGLTAKSGLSDLEDLSKTAYGLHRNLGLTITDGSRWASVAKARNIDTKSLNMTFATLSRNFVAANQGGATQLKLFHSLGVSTATLKKDQGDFNALILDTAKGFGNTTGGAQRMHAAQTLLGRGYQSVLPIFADGTKSLKEQLDWADKYHTTVTGKQLPDIEKLISAQRQSTVAWEGIKMSLGAAVLPLVTRANIAFQNLAAKLTDPHLSTQQKITILGQKLAHAAEYGFNAFVAILPKIASNVGEHAPMIAMALIHGFLAANVWGKLALGVWFLTKIGLTGTIVRGMGARIGGQLATSTVATGVAEKGAFTALGTLWGGVLGAAMIAIAAKQLSDFLDSLAPTGKGHFGSEPGLPGKQGPPGTHHIGIIPLPGPINDFLFGSTGGFVTPGGIQYRKSGGMIGGPRGTDTVPAWLTPGEGVVSRIGMARLGRAALAGINQTAVTPLAVGSGGDGRPLEVHAHFHVGAKEVASEVIHVASTAAARR